MHRADKVAAALLSVLTLVIITAPLCMAFQLISTGSHRLGLEFLLAEPIDAGRHGGIGPVLLSTLWVLATCLIATLPVGLGAALYLVETIDARTRTGRALQLALDVLGGVPSVVFGLFGNVFFCGYLGMGYSILSGGLTLTCMVLPLFVRSAEQAMRACPTKYRLAAAALDISQWGFLRRILLPFAAPGIAIGLVLAAGRALAETAVLLFTAGYVTRWPESWNDSGRTLAVHIYDLAMNVTGAGEPAAATALVLLLISLAISAIAHGLATYFRPKGM